MRKRKLRYYLSHYSLDNNAWFVYSMNKWMLIDDLNCRRAMSTCELIFSLKHGIRSARHLKKLVKGKVVLTRTYFKNGERFKRDYIF